MKIPDTRQLAAATLRTLPTRTVPPLLARPLSVAPTRIENQQEAGLPDDMKPWSNEYSVSGTTWEMCMHNTTRNGTVDPEMEMREMETREVEVEVQDEIRVDGKTLHPSVLSWSAANSQISWCTSESDAAATAIAYPNEPWITRQQPPRPELQRGLFKPVHKPPKKHLE